MTKKELEQYRSIVAEIDEVNERLRNNVVSDTVIGSDTHFPYNAHPMRVEGFADRRAAQRDKKLLKCLDEQKQAIEGFITAIPDSLTRRIFRLRHINGSRRPTWVSVAMTLGGGNTCDSVQKRHDRYLRNLKPTVLQ